MIVSANTNEEPSEFEKLLKSSKNKFDSKVKINADYFANRSPSEFEEDVCENMIAAAKSTPFKDTIELISGHKFPDIVVKNFYGVEVKAKKSDHWKTTGNSVLESTRVEDVEKIYIFFGKLNSPAEFKFRRYEECLYDVAVTHSPRYLIDMELGSDKSIFYKMGTSYDDFRNKKNPIKEIVNYYRGIAKKGEELWWMGEEENETIIKPSVSLWCNLERDEQNELRNQAMARFPEIFGNSSTKYHRLATWLAGSRGIVDPSLRDRFTAGGQEDLIINNHTYNNTPRIFTHLQENIKDVVEIVENLTLDEASYHWGITDSKESQLIDTWVDLVIENSSRTLNKSRQLIIHLLGNALGRVKSPLSLREEMKNYGHE